MVKLPGRTQLNKTITRGGGPYDQALQERSGWLIPLAILVVIAILSAIFLLLYLGPAPTSLIEEHPSPTTLTDRVRLTIGGLALSVPANYLAYANARQGGEFNIVELYAKYPGFKGFSEGQSRAFASSGVESPIIHIVIRKDRFSLDETERLKRIYLGYVVPEAQSQGPFGLTQYAFREDSGYRDEDLLVGRTKDGLVVMRCARSGQQGANSNCFRDERFAKGVALSYRFRRAYLSDWPQIAEGVNGLVRSFVVSAK